ncbi:MAG: DoxX family protein [Verrucomicrobiales bacterium]|nr:DoxX family protein [Verrucomicrobiota bacterium JB025]
MQKFSNSLLAYWGLRFAFGLSILVHGAVRFPKLAAFANGMSGQFDDTLLAGFPSLAFAYAIPFLEAGVGLALLLGGRFIRWGAFAGCLLMGGIMFGTCSLEKWDLLPSQLIHLALFYALLMNPHTPDAKPN